MVSEQTFLRIFGTIKARRAAPLFASKGHHGSILSGAWSCLLLCSFSLGCAESNAPIRPPHDALFFPVESLQDPITLDVWIASTAFDSAYDGGALTQVTQETLQDALEASEDQSADDALLDALSPQSSISDPFREVIWTPQFPSLVGFDQAGNHLIFSTREEDNRLYRISLDDNRIPNCPRDGQLIDCRGADHVRLPGNDLSAWFEIEANQQILTTFASFSEIVMVDYSGTDMAVVRQVPLPTELINVQAIQRIQNDLGEIFFLGFGQLGFRTDYTPTGVAALLFSLDDVNKGLNTADIQIIPLADDIVSFSISDFYVSDEHVWILAQDTDALFKIDLQPSTLRQGTQLQLTVSEQHFICEHADALLPISLPDEMTEKIIVACGEAKTLERRDPLHFRSEYVARRAGEYPHGLSQIQIGGSTNYLIVPFFEGDSAGIYSLADGAITPIARLGDRRDQIEDRP